MSYTTYYKPIEAIPINDNDISNSNGSWQIFDNIDMSFQGDVEIIQDWRSTMTIDDIKRKVEMNNWSAISVGDFTHAAIKSFEYQLNPSFCKPSQGYKNTLYIYTPPTHLAGKGGNNKKMEAVEITKRNPNSHCQRQARNNKEMATTNTNCCGCSNQSPARLEKQGDVDSRINLKFHIEGSS